MRRLFRSPLVALLVVGMAVPALAESGDKIVHLRLRGPLVEAPPAMEFNLFLGRDQAANMFDMLQMLKKARTDDSVKALIVDLDEAQLGLSQIQELRGQFEALRAAEKDVWVYSEACGLGTYALASSATKVVMMPRGELAVVGLYSTPMYFKGMLDKIGAQADVIHCGEYKAAGEPFSRTGPSKEAEADVNKILDSVYDTIVGCVAKSRKMSDEQVRKLLDNGPYGAKEALDAGLIDSLEYRADFIRSLKKRYGGEAKIVHNYGKKHGPEIDFENPFAIFKIFGDMMKGPKKSTEDTIAVIYVDGAITSGKSEQGFGGGSVGSDTVRKAIEDAAKDESIKAVVLRVDSPGGSAIASEIICDAAKRLKDRKPFVVSMGNVAASGGYYVSCLADQIFAQPGTITGSIGVIGMKLVTKDTWGKLGITMHEYKRGQTADIMSSLRPWSDDERGRMMKLMTRIYDEFKGRVTEGRGEKIKGDLESLAGGRIYTGAQALEIGLVDRLGGMADAIKFAADKANISKYELRVLPAPKNVFELFAKSMGMEDDEDDVSIRFAAPAAWTHSPDIQAAISALQSLDPAGVVELQAGLTQLRMLENECVLAISAPIPRMR